MSIAFLYTVFMTLSIAHQPRAGPHPLAENVSTNLDNINKSNTIERI